MNLGDSTATAALQAAQQRIKAAVPGVVAEATGNLLAQMREAATYRERGQFAFAQIHLLENKDMFVAAFDAALRDKVDEAVSPKAQAHGPREQTDWQAIGLVEEGQIEEQLSFERIGQVVSHECDAELRELSGYASALLRHGWADPERNPLRGKVIGSALHEAIEKITDDPDTQKIFASEIGQGVARALPGCYRAIIDDLKARGVRPAELTVRPTVMPAGAAHGPFEDSRKPWERSLQGRPLVEAPPTDPQRSWERSILGRFARFEPSPEAVDPDSSAALLDRLIRGGLPGSSPGQLPPPQSVAMVQADAELMDLLRRLNVSEGISEDKAGFPAARFADLGATQGWVSTARTPLAGDPAPDPVNSGLGGLMAANLIRVHRDELLQSAQGKLDHMVIEVVSSLFDQILSDSRVPPQMARQIARLQLPVLRVALKDTSFFSSRRHPVRRFINRVSALASAFDDFDAGPGQELLQRVSGLVKEIVDGDFDHLDLYEHKLDELEQFMREQVQAELKSSPAAETIRAKEREWWLQRRFSMLLAGALEPVTMSPYLKDFLAQVWGHVILTVSQRDGDDAPAALRFRRAGFDLVVSVQPKRSLEQRKEFLAALPALMGTLGEGMALIEWPDAARNAFFDNLVADHAGSLKGTPASELDYNLMLKQVEAAFRTPLPREGEAAASDADAQPVDGLRGAVIVEQRFSPEEAQSVGLISDGAVDWSSRVAPVPNAPEAPDAPSAAFEAGSDGAASPSLPSLDGAVEALGNAAAAVAGPKPEPIEPTEGPQLREHLQLGICYQLQLKDEWEKVRLTYMSPGRTLFLFSHGSKDRKAISMTARMLERLCEARRLRMFEAASLLDRATERARRQLAELAPSMHAA